MSTLYVDNLQPNLGSRVMVPGHVVQVVYSQPTGSGPNVSTITNSNADTATGKYADITLTSTTSKVLVMLTSNIQHVGDAGSGIIWGMRRDGAAIARNQSSDYIEYTVSDTNFHTTVNFKYVDAPASTSTLRYELYLSNYGSGYSLVRNWGTTNIVLMEIAQ